MWHGMGRFRWTPLLAVTAGFGAACLVWQWHAQAVRVNRTNTQLDLVMIRDSLKSLSADSAVAVSRDSIANLDARHLYELLSATNAGSYFLGHENDWDQRRELVDSWGNPFHIRLIYPGADTHDIDYIARATTVEVKIWSSGPNGKDELGAGDDISCGMVCVRLHH